MRDSIVKKLKAILSERIDSEHKVVYILAETRKLLDGNPPDPQPFALRMYCHWALHVDLTYPNTTMPFLTRVEAYVQSTLAGNPNFLEEHRLLRDFVFLDTFKDQLKRFLDGHMLPTNICDEHDRWQEFVKHYAGVIEDGSLSCSAKGEKLQNVQGVVFSKGRATRPEEGFLPFRLLWTINLHDGRSLNVEAAASALAGREAISSVLTLNDPQQQPQF
jgi:hypothetical protein